MANLTFHSDQAKAPAQPALVPRGLSPTERAERERLQGVMPKLEAELQVLRAKKSQLVEYADAASDRWNERVQALLESRPPVIAGPPPGDLAEIRQEIRLRETALEVAKKRLHTLAEWSRHFVQPHQRQGA